MSDSELRQLRYLGRLYDVQPSYFDIIAGELRWARPEALLAVLRQLGASLEHLRDLPGAIRERQQERWRRLLEPVTVAWEGCPPQLTLRLPRSLENGALAWRLELEGGESQAWQSSLATTPVLRTAQVEGEAFLSKKLTLPFLLPRGYHRLGLEVAGQRFETLVIAAPLGAYQPEEGEARRWWGVFLPLYALHTERSWGCGDLTDLAALARFVEEQGGDFVGTLPLLATFLDEPFDPSPYAPASRLFWNEFYLDLTGIPELQSCPAAQVLLSSAAFAEERERLRGSPLVDYRRGMALKRPILESLARCFFSQPTNRQADFRRFLQANPAVEDYACFRGLSDHIRTPWTAWPEPLRDGHIEPGVCRQELQRYHLYVQWLAEEQVGALVSKGGNRGPGLYLDLPLGVHPASYDVWRERRSFAQEVSGGAPPDGFFVKGQNWGFPPLHPDRLRQEGYRYFIACMRHHLRHAAIVRIDHVMGFHRLFWIPRGMPAIEGVYVRYPAEEFYAILSLESHRHRSALVAENLGTVPVYVHPALARHNISGMYVAQFEITPDPNHALRPVPHTSLAGLNTHDTPTFAGWWQGLDIQDRIELGLLEAAEAGGEHNHRATLRHALSHYFGKEGGSGNSSLEQGVRRALMEFLGSSPAELVLVNLEDLWGELRPQNVPGTTSERPNWQRKARYALEEFSEMPEVLDTLQEVEARRHGEKAKP